MHSCSVMQTLDVVAAAAAGNHVIFAMPKRERGEELCTRARKAREAEGEEDKERDRDREKELFEIATRANSCSASKFIVVISIFEFSKLSFFSVLQTPWKYCVVIVFIPLITVIHVQSKYTRTAAAAAAINGVVIILVGVRILFVIIGNMTWHGNDDGNDGSGGASPISFGWCIDCHFIIYTFLAINLSIKLAMSLFSLLLHTQLCFRRFGFPYFHAYSHFLLCFITCFDTHVRRNVVFEWIIVITTTIIIIIINSAPKRWLNFLWGERIKFKSEHKSVFVLRIYNKWSDVNMVTCVCLRVHVFVCIVWEWSEKHKNALRTKFIQFLLFRVFFQRLFLFISLCFLSFLVLFLWNVIH